MRHQPSLVEACGSCLALHRSSNFVSLKMHRFAYRPIHCHVINDMSFIKCFEILLDGGTNYGMSGMSAGGQNQNITTATAIPKLMLLIFVDHSQNGNK